MKALVLVLLLSGFVFAEGGNSTIIDFGPIINSITNLPNQIVEGFFNYVVTGLTSSVSTLISASFKFMFSNPDPNWFCAPYNAVMAILESLFSLALMGLALYFIVKSNDVEGRLTAKLWLQNMIIMMVVLSFSFPIFSMLLDFNHYLSTSLAGESMQSMFKFSTNLGAAIFAFLILIVSVAVLMLTYLTLLLRYLLIPVMLLLFPISIFLYFMPMTQSWGTAFLKVILVFVFMTTADALVLLGLSAMLGTNDPNLADALVRSIAVIIGFGCIGLVNVALIIMALLSVVMQSKALIGAAGVALLSGLVGG